MPYLRNCWYIAAWDHEVGDEPFARTLLDEPVVLYRAPDGTVAALEDRCCHRHLPLSMGNVVGDRLQCGYHGLEFDASGACVRVPGQSKIPPGAAVTSFPVVEKYTAIWIWMGASAKADEGLIPELTWMDDPGWTPAPGYVHLNADYRLLTDNLLDLTHVSYIHRSTIAGDDIEKLTAVETRRDGRKVHVGRVIPNVTPPPMYAAASGLTGTVDRWQRITWEAPSTVYLDLGCVPPGTGGPDGDRKGGISMWSTHIITPETETSTHYFFNFCRDYKLDDPEVTQQLYDGAKLTFMEDVDILEKQQARMNQMPDAPRVDVNIDNGPMQSRRVLAELIAEEAAG